MSPEERAEGRRRWARELGLRVRHEVKVQHNFIRRIIVYDWPKDDDRRFDHDVIVLVYEDESWTSALDDGTINIERSAKVLRAMALAAEKEE